jgi:hypothetical protein
MLHGLSSKKIGHFNKEGIGDYIRYDEILIQMGEGRRLTLTECLLEEQERVEEFRKIASKLSKKIRSLDPIYDEIEKDFIGYTRRCNEKLKNINDLSFSKRLKLLDSYYTLNGTHDRILRKLTNHLMNGSEGDHSPHNISLVRRAIDFTCRVMRRQPRKTSRPAALHAIEAARGAAKNGLRCITIVATLLHDVLEERLDEWTEQMINRELADSAYGEYCGKNMKEVPVTLRHKIIQKHIEAYNDRASGIFFSIGLTLYDHVRHFPVPGRYYESLHSIAEMVAALSRRRDMSYYSYLQEMLYPKTKAELDTIEYDRLLEELEPEHPDAAKLLDPYLNHVHTFYQTGIGMCSSKEEVRRNAFREILAKILDRMNNTRDLDRNQGFSIPTRLYGTGFKNIFFLQAVEDKLRRPSFNTEERRLIEVKFINKPKVAALYQILDDIQYISRSQNKQELFTFLEKEIERYKGTSAFRRLTPPGRGGYFNGLVYLFNDITMGRKSNLVELEKRPDKIAEVLVAFKSVLESFLVYPALIRDERKNRGLGPNESCCFRPYRIEGMGPSLERRSSARSEHRADELAIKTFIREVI